MLLLLRRAPRAGLLCAPRAWLAPLAVVVLIGGLAGAAVALVTCIATATPAAALGASAVTVVSTANPSVGGQAVTLRASVSAVGPASGSPVGTVSFRDATRDLGTAAWWFGSYSVSVSDLSAGNHAITATFNASTTFAGSSTTMTQTVVAASTSVTLTSSSNPSTVGDAVTLKASVVPSAPSTAVVTGPVTFSEGTQNLATVSPWYGAGTLALPKLAPGAHVITATYAGDARTRSSSASLSLTIRAMATTVAVATSLDPVVTGQRATLTATITPATSNAGSPMTPLTFTEGTTTLGTAVWWFGSYSTVLPALVSGDHTITASFAGDTTFAPSAASLTQRVRTSTTMSASVYPAPSVTNQAVTIAATVLPATPGGPGPTGLITDGATALASPALSQGRATASFSNLAAGDHVLQLTYAGDGINAASSTSVTVVVRIASTLTVTSAANPSAVGQAVTFTARVTPAPAGAGATGTVTLVAGVTSFATASVVDGTATTTLVGLSAGSHTVTATYSGDGMYRYGTAVSSQVVGTAALTATQSAPLIVTAQPTSYRALGADPASVGAHYEGDGGNEITLPSDGNILWATSDYAGTDANGTEFMVNNVVSISSPANPMVQRQPRGPSGGPYQLINPTSPSSCIAPGSHRVLWNAGMVALPEAGWDKVLIWFQAYCLSKDLVLSPQSIGLAELDYHPAMATDMVAPWSTHVTILSDDLYGAPSGVQLPELGPDGLVYLYRCYTNGVASAGSAVLGCKVARVAPLDAASASQYRYWDGTGWGATTEAGAAYMSTPDETTPSRQPAGMFKVTYVPQMGVWVLGSQAWPGYDGTPLFRISRTPQGPWSTPVTVPYLGCDPTTGHTCYGSMVSAALSDATHLTVVYFDRMGQAPGYMGKHLGQLHVVTAGVIVPAPGAVAPPTTKVTTTTVRSSANPATAGQAATLSATVVGPPPVADAAGVVDTSTPSSGVVTFREAATVLGTASWFFGSFNLSLPALEPGVHTITATYSGAGSFTASSGAVTVTVVQAQTALSVAPTTNPAAFGTPVGVRATLSVTAPGAGTPTGPVTFREGATALGTASVFFGAYTVTLPSLAVGDHQIVVSYAGDGRYGAASATFVQSVARAAATMTLTTSASSARVGAGVSFAAVVTGAAGVAPAGTVTFRDGSVLLGTATWWFGSYALTVGSLGVGTHTITATFSGDSDFLGATATVNQTIIP